MIEFFITAAAATFLVGLGSFVPGFLVVRHLRLDPRETLVSSIAASHVLIYLAAFTTFLTGGTRAAGTGISIALVAATVMYWRQIAEVLRESRGALHATGVIAVSGFALLGLVRHYSGGEWSGDWFMHYERMLFFLRELPGSHQFIDGFPVTSRPPMMNLLAAHYAAQVGSGFPAFQVVMFLLNLSIIPALWLVAGTLFKRKAVPFLLLASLSSVLLMHSLTYTWVRMFCYSFVLLGIAAYVRGVREEDRRRIILAFASFAAACLVHYSAAPYVVFFAAHCLIRCGRRRDSRTLAAVAFAGAAILATWFVPSVILFGTDATFGGTTTSEGFRASPSAVVERLVTNTMATVFPHPLRLTTDEFEQTFAQSSFAGFWRDWFFLMYLHNLIVGGGLILGIWTALLLLRPRRRHPEAAPQASLSHELPVSRRTPSTFGPAFWWAFFLVTFLLGLFVTPTTDLYGQAHVCAQPLILLGIAYFASRAADFSRGVRLALPLFALLDALAGVALQFRLQHLPAAHDISGGDLPSLPAIGNMKLKLAYDLTFAGDVLAPLAPLLVIVAVGVYAWAMVNWWRTSFADYQCGRGL